MVRAKLSVRTVTTKITPEPGSWSFRGGWAALKRQPERNYLRQLILKSTRFIEARRLCPLFLPHYPRRNRGAPLSSSQAPHPSLPRRARKLTRFAAPPLPIQPASLGLYRAPVLASSASFASPGWYGAPMWSRRTVGWFADPRLPASPERGGSSLNSRVFISPAACLARDRSRPGCPP